MANSNRRHPDYVGRCLGCARELFTWNVLFTAPSLAGPALLCIQCQVGYPSARKARADELLVGQDELERWHDSGREW